MWLPWKLDNPSCHNLHTAQSKCNCLQRNGTKEGHITSRVGDYWMRLILGRATMNDDNLSQGPIYNNRRRQIFPIFWQGPNQQFFSLLKVSKSRKQIFHLNQKRTIFFFIFALASKMDQLKKWLISLLISDYLLSNIIICICIFLPILVS